MKTGEVDAQVRIPRNKSWEETSPEHLPFRKIVQVLNVKIGDPKHPAGGRSLDQHDAALLPEGRRCSRYALGSSGSAVSKIGGKHPHREDVRRRKRFKILLIEITQSDRNGDWSGN